MAKDARGRSTYDYILGLFPHTKAAEATGLNLSTLSSFDRSSIENRSTRCHVLAPDFLQPKTHRSKPGTGRHYSGRSATTLILISKVSSIYACVVDRGSLFLNNGSIDHLI